MAAPPPPQPPPPPPPPTSSFAAAILPWAWAIELLSDLPSVPLPVLAGLIEKVPERSGEWFKDARERFALRCLQDLLHSGSLVDDSVPPGTRVVGIDEHDSCEDVFRKLARIKAEGKSMGELMNNLEHFIQRKGDNLAAPFLRKLKDCNAPLQSSNNEFNNVRHEDVCPGNNRSLERMGSKDGKTNVPQSSSFNRNLPFSENMNGDSALGRDVYDNGSKISESYENNVDSRCAEKIPVKQPSTFGDVWPPFERAGDCIAGSRQNLDQANDISHREILSPANFSNNDRNGDFKNIASQKVVVEKLEHLLSSEGSPNTLSESSEPVRCFKCGKEGMLLTCYSSGCPVAVHVSCLGSFKELEGSRKFQCPFCSYSSAHGAYLSAKKKALVAKKELSALLQGISVKDGDFKNELVDLIKSTVSDPRSQVKETRVSSQCRNTTSKQVDKQPGIFLDRCKEAEAGTFGNEAVSSGDAQNRDILHNQCRKSTSEQLGKKAGGSMDTCKEAEEHAFVTLAGTSADADNHNFQINDYCGRGVINGQPLKTYAETGKSLGDRDMVSSSSKDKVENLEEGGGLNMRKVVLEKDVEDAVDNIIDDEVDKSFILKRRAKKRRHDNVQPFIVPEKLRKLGINEKGITRKSPRVRKLELNEKGITRKSPRKLGINEKGITRKSPRNLTPTKCYINPSFPVGRRTRLQWTPDEEEALKEFVQKFSLNNEGVIPWKTILEHGSHVFHSTRTPTDLKDKWKNILKYQGREEEDKTSS